MAYGIVSVLVPSPAAYLLSRAAFARHSCRAKRPLVLVLFLLPFRAQLRRRLPYGSLKVLQPPPRKAAGPPARITAAMAALVMALQTATVKGSRAAPDSAGDSNIMAQLLMMMLVFIIIGVFVAGMKLGATMERIRSHDTRVKDVPPQLTVTQNAPIQADPAGRSRRSSRGTDRAIDRAIYVTKGGDPLPPGSHMQWFTL